MSLWETSASSYGEGLQNLRYRNERKHSSLGREPLLFLILGG